MNSLRVIFMGTPEFAVPSLEALIENKFEVVAVVTAPDKPQGRGLKPGHSAVKACAIKHKIPVLQPTNLKDPAFASELKSLGANLQVVVAFRMLPEVIWSMPALGTFNLHASLLPQYRGAAPINWVIINGEKETGLTTFFLQHEIDTGNMIFQEKEPIAEDETAGTLYTRLMKKGSALVVKTAKAIEAGNVTTKPQQPADNLRPAPRIFKETCFINWDKKVEEIRNHVRGLSPYPAAWTILNDVAYKLYRVTIAPYTEPGTMGKLVTDNKSYLYVKALDGWISVAELQPEGKRRMTIEEFLRGNKF